MTCAQGLLRLLWGGAEVGVLRDCTMTCYIVKHHYSYKSNNCTFSLMAKMFPESSTAEKYSCARTKIEDIVNFVLAPPFVQCVLNDVEEHEVIYLGVTTNGNYCYFHNY